MKRTDINWVYVNKKPSAGDTQIGLIVIENNRGELKLKNHDTNFVLSLCQGFPARERKSSVSGFRRFSSVKK